MDKDVEKYINRLRARRDQFKNLLDKGALMEKWENAFNLKHYETEKLTDEQETSYRHIDTVTRDYPMQLMAMLTVPQPIRTFYAQRENNEQFMAIQDDAEKYVAAVWAMNRRRSPVNPMTAIMHDQLVRGRAYAHVYVDLDRMELYRESTGLPRPAYFPICITCINPRFCYPNPEPGYWSWTDDFIYAMQMSPNRAAKQWGREAIAKCIDEPSMDWQNEDNDIVAVAESEDDQQVGLYEHVDIWEFETEGGKPELWHAVIYNEEWVRPPEIMDKYVDLPFVLIPGVDLPYIEPEKQMTSILVPVLPGVETSEHIVNRIMTASTYQADPIILTQLADPVQLKKGPGQVWPVKQGDRINYLMGVGVPNQLFQMYQLLQGDVERSSLARVAYGQAPGAWSGYMAQQAIAGSTLKNQLPIDNLCEGLTAIDQHIIDLTVSHFDGDAEIVAYGKLRGTRYNVTIKPKQLEGLHILTIVAPKTFTDEQAKMGLAMGYRQPGPSGMPLLGDDYIRREVLAIEDATGAKQAIIGEMLQSIPAVQLHMARVYVEKSGLPKDVKDAVIQTLSQQIGQAGQVPGQPPPGAAPQAGQMAAQQGGPQAGVPGEQMPPGAAQMPPGAAPQQGPPPDQVIAAIRQGINSGQVPPDIGERAIQMIQQGTPLQQVAQFIQGEMMKRQGQPPAAPQPQMPGGAPPQMPPQAMPPAPQGAQAGPQGAPPTGMPPEVFAQGLMESASKGDIPQEIAQQAVALLNQGQSVQQVYEWIMAQAEAARQQQGQAPAGPQVGGPGVPSGEMTIDEAIAFLRQNGLDDMIPKLIMLVEQQGLGVAEALQAVIAEASQVAEGAPV